MLGLLGRTTSASFLYTSKTNINTIVSISLFKIALPVESTFSLLYALVKLISSPTIYLASASISSRIGPSFLTFLRTNELSYKIVLGVRLGR